MADMPSVPADLQERVDKIRNNNKARLDKLGLSPIDMAQVTEAEMGMILTLLVEREYDRDPEVLVVIEQRRADLISQVESLVNKARLAVITDGPPALPPTGGFKP